MSSSGQIQAVRRSEQRYPVDLSHNGRQYRRGRSYPSGSFLAAQRHVRKIKRPSVEQIQMVVRLHRVSA